MDRAELLARLRALPFDPAEYWLITGGAMLLYGLRERTHDIDLGCTAKLADTLEAQGCPCQRTADGKRWFRLEDDLEVFEDWIYDRVVSVEGVPVISLPGLLAMKQALGREKDLRDVALIQARLWQTEQSAKQDYPEFQPIQPAYDAAMAELVRVNLKNHKLDVSGTAYFDEALDHLSAFYRGPGREYYVLLENGAVEGGIGIAEFRGDCCEMQKLYLADAVKGRGLGYEMIRFIEARARALGYRSIYLETHTNLAAAIHVYERSGYREIPRPAGVVHGTMNKFYQKQL